MTDLFRLQEELIDIMAAELNLREVEANAVSCGSARYENDALFRDRVNRIVRKLMTAASYEIVRDNMERMSRGEEPEEG